MGWRRVHIIGAGIAGLSCAVDLAARGIEPILHDMAGQAGGRCRSFDDATIGARIDNGNHLALSGNRHLFTYLERIGARSQWRIAPKARFPFVDLGTGRRWALEISDGLWPSWIFDRRRRPPDTDWRDFLPLLRLALGWAGSGRVGDLFPPSSPAFERLWGPLILAVLNTPARQASAPLLRAMLWRSFLRGGRHSRPCTVRRSLSAALIDPALATLRRQGARIVFSSRLRGIVRRRGRVTALRFAKGEEPVDADTAVVLAVPAPAAGKLLPEIDVPIDHSPILNLHFRLPRTARRRPPFIGLIGGIGHWLFVRENVASVTVSAAQIWMDRDDGWLARRIWPEVARALDQPHPRALPRYRVIREKRATFTQTADGVRSRPATPTASSNLLLAGDWIDTGLPATLESAAAAGHAAARIIASRADQV